MKSLANKAKSVFVPLARSFHVQYIRGTDEEQQKKETYKEQKKEKRERRKTVREENL
jgi:hypothetical protein